jgi:hypothetical protein
VRLDVNLALGWIKRTAITPTQQYRYHLLVDSLWAEMRAKNTGVCPEMGKTFGELAIYFLLLVTRHVCWLAMAR